MKILAGTVEKSDLGDNNQSAVKRPKKEVSIDIDMAARTDTDTEASQGSINLLGRKVAEIFQQVTKMTPLEKVEWVLIEVGGIIIVVGISMFMLVVCAIGMIYLMMIFGAVVFMVWLVVMAIFGL